MLTSEVVRYSSVSTSQEMSNMTFNERKLSFFGFKGHAIGETVMDDTDSQCVSFAFDEGLSTFPLSSCLFTPNQVDTFLESNTSATDFVLCLQTAKFAQQSHRKNFAMETSLQW